MQKRKRSKQQQRKNKLELEDAAAARSMLGNGSDPSLPPLPKRILEHWNGGGAGGCLFTSHPYGVLPYGNIYASSDGDVVRRKGLGSIAILNDEQITNGVLRYLDGISLARIIQCSRYLYVCGMADSSQWRDLTLRFADGNNEAIQFSHSWKTTYVRQQQRKKNFAHSYIEHVPIKVKGVFSDVLFRVWLCQQFHVDESFLEVDNICRERHEDLTVEKFLKHYEEPNIPVVIEGATKSWPAVQKWDRKYLTMVCGDQKFRATSACAPLPAQFDMASYFKYVSAASEEMPLYLFDRNFNTLAPQLLKDYKDFLPSTCPYFDPEAAHGHDLFSKLGDRRPDFRWLIVGPQRSGSAFHIDPNATHAWNAPIRGRKRWIFYPPGVPPPGVLPSSNGDDVIMPVSVGEWYLSFWDEHVKNRNNKDKSKRPIECTVEPGSILFVPHGWWHTVLNLDEDSIALTQNYVSASNLSDVLKFLRDKEQQISGCRDRAEAVKADTILEEFTDAMLAARKDLFTTANSVQHWKCSAWVDDIEKECDHVNKKQNIFEKAKEKGTFTFEFSF